jgi:hypothetical protein
MQCCGFGSTIDLSFGELSRWTGGHSAFSRVSALFVSPSKKERWDSFETGRNEICLIVYSSVDCLACQDTFEGRACFHAPCGHYFCPECTATMAMAAVAEGNEELFPLRCCNELFHLKEFLKSLAKPLRLSVAEKSNEMSLPGPQRLYCPNDTCSAFLGMTPRRKKLVSCPRCHAEVCSGCKHISHSPKPCKPDDLALEAREFASERGWMVCPGCAVIVEREGGCSHMTCRCGTEFCYRCGRVRQEGSRCKCPMF